MTGTLREQAGRVWRRSVAGYHALSGKAVRARRALDGSNAIVLMYHRVLPHEEARRRVVEPGMYVSPETFACHVDVLADLFSVLPLHEIVTRTREGKSLPKAACAITFDDGWRDNHEFALPILESRGLPATIFVVTGRVGTKGAFWPDEVSQRWVSVEPADRQRIAVGLGIRGTDASVDAVISELKEVSEAARCALLEQFRDVSTDPLEDERELLDWDELADLSARGVDIESHGVSHAILTGVGRSDVKYELEKARESLIDRGHGQHALLAYPSGSFNEDVVRMATQTGYLGAFTTERGVVSRAHGPLTLPRIGLHDDISSSRLEFLRWVPGQP